MADVSSTNDKEEEEEEEQVPSNAERTLNGEDEGETGGKKTDGAKVEQRKNRKDKSEERPTTETEQEDMVKKRVLKSKLYIDVEPHQWPIVYSSGYNISFLGLEKLHPFDSGKWGRVHQCLKKDGMICDETTVCPVEATEDDLLVAHTKQYLNRLKWSISVAGITEVPPVALLPNFVVQKKLLKPLRLQTGGTILAAKLALDRGWAINIGGGFHHCSSRQGGGFCAYADITLALRFLFVHGLIQKAMIVDLDAHQGNGHGRDFMNDPNVYIMDVYNRQIYPRDGFAKRGITRKVEIDFFTADERYLTAVASNLEAALDEFTPDILLYNAGTDCLEGDPLGALSITPQGIVKRDMMVFEFARDRRKPIPIIMVTSGGYQRNNAEIISSSIQNLFQRRCISCPEAVEFQEKLKSSTSPSKLPASGAEAITDQPSTSQAAEGSSQENTQTSEAQGKTFLKTIKFWK